MKTRLATLTISAILAVRFVAALLMAPTPSEADAVVAGATTPLAALLTRLIESGGGLAWAVGAGLALAGVVTVWVIHQIARNFSARAGRFTLVLGALSPGLIIADVRYGTEVLLALTIALALWALQRWLFTRTWNHAALAGIAVGGCVAIDPVIAAWSTLAVLIILATSTNGSDAWRTVRHLTVAALIAALCAWPLLAVDGLAAGEVASTAADAATRIGTNFTEMARRAVDASVTPISASVEVVGDVPFHLAQGLMVLSLALFAFGMVLMPKLLRGTGVIDHRDQALDRLSALCAGDREEGNPALIESFEDRYGVRRPDHSPSHHALSATTAWLLGTVVVFYFTVLLAATTEVRTLTPAVPTLIVVGAIGLDELLSRLRAPHV